MNALDRIKTRAQRRRLDGAGYLGRRRGLCSLQDDLSVANASGAAVRADLNNQLQSLGTLMSGASAPSTTYSRMLWADTSSNLLKRRNAANSAWLVVYSLDESFVVSRASNTILAIADADKTFIATGTFTQTLTAAATLADGWAVNYRNDGSGVITLDPNSSETIDGSATIDLGPGESCRIVCNGTAFKTVGRQIPARVGQVIEYAGTGVPVGFLACDGSAVSRATYSALFTEIGTTHGIGDGSTTFNVPDQRRKGTIGSGGSGTGTIGNAVGNTGGEETHALTIGELAAHDHVQTIAQNGTITGGTQTKGINDSTGAGAGGQSTQTTGSGTAHNNMPPSIVMRKVIKY